jgi:uncharacterized membrane protein YfcA
MEMADSLVYVVALIFIVVAFSYSSVGLGGASSYTALMAIFGFSVLAIPTVSLSLNLIVTTAGSINFIRNGHARFRLIFPFLITSMPFAYLGGSLQLPKTVFYLILLTSLIFVALRIFFWQSTTIELSLKKNGKIGVALISGAILGLIAGIVGIGGGIYLVPLILVLGLGTEKQAAACGAIFVFANSLTGLASRWQYNPVDLEPYVALFIAVLIGGVAGSFYGSFKFSPRLMEKILGAVIVVAIVFLLKKLIFAVG